MAPFFGDLSQSENISEIRPPLALALHFGKKDNKGISNTFSNPCFHIIIFFFHAILSFRERKSNVFRLAIKVNFQNFFHSLRCLRFYEIFSHMKFCSRLTQNREKNPRYIYWSYMNLFYSNVGFLVAPIKYNLVNKKKYHLRYKDITLWHSTFRQNPVKNFFK